MAWQRISHLGKTSGTGTPTSTVVAAFVGSGGTIAVGEVIFIYCATRNELGGSGQSNFHSSGSDTKGNNYTKLREESRGTGLAGVTLSVWMSQLTTALEVGDQVTITLGGTTDRTFIAGIRFTATGTVGLEAAAGANGGGGIAVSLSGMPSRSYFLLGIVVEIGNTAQQDYIADGNYKPTRPFIPGQEGPGAEDEVLQWLGGAEAWSYTGWRGAILTGDTFNPGSLGMTNWVAILAAIEDQDPTWPGTDDITPQLSGILNFDLKLSGALDPIACGCIAAEPPALLFSAPPIAAPCGDADPGLAVFPFDPDWSDGIGERPAWLTDVLPGYTDAEQRIALRRHPRFQLEYRIHALDARESAALEALLYGWQANKFAVPLWPDALRLEANAAAGATTIQLTAAMRRFAAGGRLLLWRDPYTYELATIQTVNPSSIALTAPLAQAWNADGLTWVLPALVGRLDDSQPVRRPAPFASQLTVRFECEPQPGLGPI